MAPVLVLVRVRVLVLVLVLSSVGTRRGDARSWICLQAPFTAICTHLAPTWAISPRPSTKRICLALRN